MIITGTDGADNIDNTVEGATVQSRAGNDSIINSGDDGEHTYQ